MLGRRFPSTLALAPALLVLCGSPVRAQTSSLMTDLMRDVAQVEEKLVGLAEAMPEGAYAWRPGEGVRSVSEVFAHVASDNYLLPATLGHAPPAETGIDGSDYMTAVAFERRSRSKEEVVAELRASFAFLEGAMEQEASSDIGREVTLFGSRSTAQQVWIMTTTHLHEHLGQAIAYARSNGVVPPWSN